MQKSNYTISIAKNNPKSKLLFICLITIDQVFSKIDLQITRIKGSRRDRKLKILFADIHFFLVAVSNLQKLLKYLRRINSRDPAYQIIYKKYITKLLYLTNFRDHLEHIDEGRLEGKGKKGAPLRQPGSLGNLINDNYDFGGEIFNLPETFQLLSELKSDLIDWDNANKIYQLWGTV